MSHPQLEVVCLKMKIREGQRDRRATPATRSRTMNEDTDWEKVSEGLLTGFVTGTLRGL